MVDIMGPVERLGVRLRLLMSRDDFRANPLKAFSKRIFYRLRWKFTRVPWTLWLDNEFRVDAPKGSPGAYIYYYGASEPQGLQMLKQLLKPGMVFVDIGAHLGEYSLVASRIVGSSGAVHAFEPGATVYPYLRRNIEQNFAQNVTCHRFAVSDIDGELQFNIDDDPGHSRLLIDGNGDNGMPSHCIDTVSSVRLDTWIRNHDDLHIDVMKVDVEGVELSVLRGAEQILARSGESAPILLFEYHPPNWNVYGYTFDEAQQFLSTFCYTVFGYSPNHGLFPIDKEEQAVEASNNLDLILLALKPEHQALNELQLSEVAAPS